MGRTALHNEEQVQSLETVVCAADVWESECGWSEESEKSGKKWCGRDSSGQII